MKRHGKGFVIIGWVLLILGLAFIILPLATSQDLLSQINGKFDIADLYFVQHEDSTIRLNITIGIILFVGGLNSIGIGKILKLINIKLEKAPLE